MDLLDLKVLVEFYNCKSVTLTVKRLYTTQSNVSKILRRVEQYIGVELFTKVNNKLILNQNGLIAVEKAKEVINCFDELKESVNNNNKKIKHIKVGACSFLAKAKTIRLCDESMTNLFADVNIDNESNLMKGLENSYYDFVVLNSFIKNDKYLKSLFFEETLCITLPKNHKLAGCINLSLSQLDGESILTIKNLGVWDTVIKKYLPNSKIIAIEDVNDFFTLTSSSNLPIFNSFESIEIFGEPNDKVTIKFKDKFAKLKYYVYANENVNEQYLALFNIKV